MPLDLERHFGTGAGVVKAWTIVEGEALVLVIDPDGEATQQLVSDKENGCAVGLGQSGRIKGLIVNHKIADLQCVYADLMQVDPCGTGRARFNPLCIRLESEPMSEALGHEVHGPGIEKRLERPFAVDRCLKG